MDIWQILQSISYIGMFLGFLYTIRTVRTDVSKNITKTGINNLEKEDFSDKSYIKTEFKNINDKLTKIDNNTKILLKISKNEKIELSELLEDV